MASTKRSRPPTMRNVDWVALSIGTGFFTGAIAIIAAALAMGEPVGSWAWIIGGMFTAAAGVAFLYVGRLRTKGSRTAEPRYRATCAPDHSGEIVLDLSLDSPGPHRLIDCQCRVVKRSGGWIGYAREPLSAMDTANSRLTLTFPTRFSTGDGDPAPGLYTAQWTGTELDDNRFVTPKPLAEVDFYYESPRRTLRRRRKR